MSQLADFENAIAAAVYDVLPECGSHDPTVGEPYCEYIGVAVAARVEAAPLDVERLGRALHSLQEHTKPLGYMTKGETLRGCDLCPFEARRIAAAYRATT